MSHRNNSTGSDHLGSQEPQIWTFIPSCALVVLLTAILANGSVLFLFIKHAHLRTAFAVYLINLLFASLISQLIQSPIYLVANLRPYWWIGRPACSAYIYGFFVQAGTCNAHALISINRLWAVLQPISYRRLHSKRTAWIICGVMWLYIHVLTLPGFIADILYYRFLEETHGCFLNKGPQPGWAYPHQFIVFSLPVLIMVLSYPVISIKTLSRRVAGRTNVQPASNTPAVSIKLKKTGLSDGQVTGGHRAIELGSLPKVAVVPSAREQRSRSFLVLTVATLSMLIFWMPSIVFYTTMMFQDVSGWTGVQDAATVLLFLESVMDPILFTLALPDLKIAFVKTFLFRNVAPL